MSRAVTQGIEVEVESQYQAMHSSPARNRYVFSYTVIITNVGDSPAKLETRHWIVTDALGVEEHVRGPGVVGETPRLAPGQSFQYTSGCVLKTARGTMHGSYHMVRDDGACFDAEIAPFVLVAPGAESNRYLN